MAIHFIRMSITAIQSELHWFIIWKFTKEHSEGDSETNASMNIFIYRNEIKYLAHMCFLQHKYWINACTMAILYETKTNVHLNCHIFTLITFFSIRNKYFNHTHALIGACAMPVFYETYINDNLPCHQGWIFSGKNKHYLAGWGIMGNIGEYKIMWKTTIVKGALITLICVK